jgi:cysteinyl-tRNA synthetase
MIKIIERLIANRHAYAANGHVLFSVKSYEKYGALSGRIQDDLVAGARVEVESYKRDPGDFVLWKPADAEDDPSSVFDSPWGKGRPGWHIECSAMSSTYLGETFDIHGGGADLMFPHHENEIAQSRCAAPGSEFARYWVHNGFLTVNGEKMSKSLGNFITVRDLLDKGVKGEVIRYALLSTGYNKPLDWNEKLLEDAKKAMDKFYHQIAEHPQQSEEVPMAFVDALCDDMNIPVAFSLLHGTLKREELQAAGKLLGLFAHDPAEWFHTEAKAGEISDSAVAHQIEARVTAKKAKNFAEADRIRKELADQGILLEDKPGGVTEWRRA